MNLKICIFIIICLDPEWDAKVEGPWGPGGHKKMKAGDKAAEGPADTEDTEDMEDVEDKPPRKETKKVKLSEVYGRKAGCIYICVYFHGPCPHLPLKKRQISRT